MREISYLGKKFIMYLALAQRASQDKIKKHIKTKGGYILHLDGTCEGDSPHLFSFIDELSSIVLDNIKIPSENTQQIKPPLEEIKKVYGDPIAVVHDMSAAIISAVESVFPDAKDFICHLHFKKMVKQIDKYWNKLFANPIEVKTDLGVVMMQPQRTNNMLERFFRKMKSGARKKKRYILII